MKSNSTLKSIVLFLVIVAPLLFWGTNFLVDKWLNAGGTLEDTLTILINGSIALIVLSVLTLIGFIIALAKKQLFTKQEKGYILLWVTPVLLYSTYSFFV